MVVNNKKQELLTLRDYMGSRRFLPIYVLLIFLDFCDAFFFALSVFMSSSCGLRVKYCQCLWIVLWSSLMFT